MFACVCLRLRSFLFRFRAGQTVPRSDLGGVQLIIHKEEKIDIDEMEEMHAEEIIIAGM